jgi:uncharacterized protein (TIGR03086 family)
VTVPVPADPDGRLARALEATARLVDGVRDEQWAAPTGCPGWTVRDLIAHLVGGTRGVAAALRGEAPPDGDQPGTDQPGTDQPGTDQPGTDPPGTDPPGTDPAAALRAAGEQARAAFAAPGALERVVSVPAGVVPGAVALHLRLTELLVHGWDLARATGQPTTGLPEDLAEEELAFSRVQLGRVPPGRSPFGPPQPVADDAPAVDRLAALLGRSPGPVAAPR